MGFFSSAAGDPKSVPSQLAQALPRAANYFMSYVLVKALSGAASALLQPVALFGQMISRLQDVTPRQKWTGRSVNEQNTNKACARSFE